MKLLGFATQEPDKNVGGVDDLLVDIAHFSHLPNSPVVVPVGSDSDRSMDVMEGALGLLYMRKRPRAGRKTSGDGVKLEGESAPHDVAG